MEVVLAEDASLSAKTDTERHLQEKRMLRQRLDKKQGVWNEHHPRYRLLEALRGFSAYAETQQTELNRLKGLYNHVSKAQKKACAHSAIPRSLALRFANMNQGS
jgi:carnosine N-methyltransferase